jgi:aryl-alcohol dehydrogenase-like predicted oxidoreductase
MNYREPPQFEPGDHRKNSKAFSAEEIAKLKPKLEKLKSRFGPTTENLPAVALNYVLVHPNVACVIPGFRNERQARCNLAADGKTLNSDDFGFVREALA